MISTPADPVANADAIDYDDLVKLLRTPHKGEKGHYRQTRNEAADAVEALRERVAELESMLPLRGQYVSMRADNAEQNTRAEAAEACMAELAGALEFYASRSNHDAKVLQSGFGRSNVSEDDGLKARAALAATPAEALERARSFEQLARDAVSDLGRYAQDASPERRMVSVRLYEKTLDKLDALGKEGP